MRCEREAHLGKSSKIYKLIIVVYEFDIFYGEKNFNEKLTKIVYIEHHSAEEINNNSLLLLWHSKFW